MAAMADRSIVAIDGGASKTDVIIFDEHGKLAAWRRGGGSNHQMYGVDTAISNIAALIALAKNDSATSNLDVGIFCLAGIDLASDEKLIGAALAPHEFAPTTVLLNDTFALLAAGSDATCAIALVCGTGLNCVGRSKGAAHVRFPSLGELSGDFTPGGAWLGIRGLGCALRARDGRGATTLLERAVPQYFDLASPEEVLESVYTGSIRFHRLAELAEVVLSCAGNGDPVAHDMVALLANEAALMANAAISRIALQPTSRVDVVMGGGLFNNATFSTDVGKLITQRHTTAHLVRSTHPLVLGAGFIGLDYVGSTEGAKSTLLSELSGRSPKGQTT
jgi:N-acetylglucosamine kinase-like BadF-type ATPase